MKSELRLIYKNKRKELSKTEAAEKSKAAQTEFLNSPIYKKAETVMLYYPIGNETDTSAIAERAFADKKRLIYPVTDEKSGEITPYYVKENGKFHIGAFSVPEPEKNDAANLNDIDVVIVPGIAFSREGARIGFGKGCYDRFLGNINAVKVGLCYDFQICSGLNVEQHDVNMDFLVTESGVKACE